MTQSNLKPAAETDSGYGQLFAVLLRRRFWFLGVLGVVVVLATLKTFTQEPTYKSSMQLLVEPNYQEKQNKQEMNSLPTLALRLTMPLS